MDLSTLRSLLHNLDVIVKGGTAPDQDLRQGVFQVDFPGHITI